MEREKQQIKLKLHLPREAGYLLLLIFCIILYLFLHSHFIMTAVILLLSFPVISLVMAYRMAGAVSLRIVPLQEKIRKREEGAFVFSLSNSFRWLSLHCELNGSMTNTLYGCGGELKVVMPISMKATEVMTLPIVSEYSGNVKICVHEMEYLDLLGLFSIRKQMVSEGELVVLPESSGEVRSKKNGFEMGMSELEESKAKGNDFAEVTDMREYRPGDRIKDIHWKLSAKKDILMVKERTSVAQSQVILVLELSGDRDATEEVMTLAYNVTKGFLAEYVPVRLMWWNESLYDFAEVMISSAGEVDGQFATLLHTAARTQKQDLPVLVPALRPYLQAFVILGMHNGTIDGEVIRHG